MFEDPFVKNTLTPFLAIIGAVFGLVGTCLGVLNYRLTRKRQKVLCRVEATNQLTLSNGKPESLKLIVKVINSGFIPVTISEIGMRVGKEYLAIDQSNSSRSVTQADSLPVRV